MRHPAIATHYFVVSVMIPLLESPALPELCLGAGPDQVSVGGLGIASVGQMYYIAAQSFWGDVVMIAVGGENLIDFVSGSPVPGVLPQYTANPGGAPYNAAMAAARQGQPVAYLTPISTDSLGDLLIDRLVDSQVTISTPRVDHPTSLAVVSLDDKGVPSYAFHRNGTAERQVSFDGLAAAMPSGTKIFHVGGLALIDGDDADAWEAFFYDCADRGIVTSLDPNVRPALVSDRDSYVARVKRMLKRADLVKLSDEDMLWLYPDMSLEDALAACRADCDAALFILTKGPDGADGFSPTASVTVPARKVTQLADTVGAGDTFMASILAWVMEQGLTARSSLATLDASAMQAAMTRAGEAAAINCERSGCNPPSRDELGLA